MSMMEVGSHGNGSDNGSGSGSGNGGGGGGSDSLSMQEVLEREQRLQEEAREQMRQNWGKENQCTFAEGYIRQPVYACLTCKESGKTGPVSPNRFNSISSTSSSLSVSSSHRAPFRLAPSLISLFALVLFCFSFSLGSASGAA